MHGLITQIKGDYELAQEWYGAKGKYYYSFMYPSNLYKEYYLKKVEKDPGKTYIQVGNSACETNEHVEVFEKLLKYKGENIEIICPLSYSGKEEYIKQVVETGYKTFGKEKFTPIVDFMIFDQYLELLAKVDIAIFNHKRQRGLGNITTLLGLGKKVYIREEITTYYSMYVILLKNLFKVLRVDNKAIVFIISILLILITDIASVSFSSNLLNYLILLVIYLYIKNNRLLLQKDW